MAVNYTAYILLDNDCSIRVYKLFVVIFQKLCLMLLVTYYAQNYAGIIGWFLVLHTKELPKLPTFNSL